MRVTSSGQCTVSTPFGVSFRADQGRRDADGSHSLPALVASVVRSRLTFRIGSRRYALDIEARSIELKPTPAGVIPINGRATTRAKRIAKD